MGNGELEWRPAECNDERRERAYLAEKGKFLTERLTILES